MTLLSLALFALLFAPSEPRDLGVARIVGHVTHGDGTPAEGAFVVTSAGGLVVVDVDGSFELELPLDEPRTAVSVSATLSPADESILCASTAHVGVSAGSTTSTGVLVVSPAADCEYRWRSTFGAENGVDGVVHAAATIRSGPAKGVYVGGSFGGANGVPAENIARWDGARWSRVGTGVGGTVHDLVVRNGPLGPELYAAGSFFQAGGEFAPQVARWDGFEWSPVGTAGFASDEVESIAWFDDGSGPCLYAVSNITVHRWDGQAWTPLVTGSVVHALEVFDDGAGPALYVGGEFTAIGGVFANGVARWDGTSWSALGSGVTGTFSASVVELHASALLGGPRLYVGGVFQAAGGIPTESLASWDGSSWARSTRPRGPRRSSRRCSSTTTAGDPRCSWAGTSSEPARRRPGTSRAGTERPGRRWATSSSARPASRAASRR